jgi:UDP-N-acetylmuramyl pentapeptide phosphotransferase/UDP-N-acetylglucosamine-1-phosphate transferase
MKDSHQVLVVAGVLILIGIVLIGLSRSNNIPSTNNPFLSTQAFFTMGFLYLGFSFGLLGAIDYIFRLEKKIPQTPPPP